jgi:AraC-like DNA-binding protein
VTDGWIRGWNQAPGGHQIAIPRFRQSGRVVSMLVARGTTKIGAASMRWALTFASRFWSVLVVRDGFTLDTRFVPAPDGAPKGNAILYVLLEGVWVELGGKKRTFNAPCSFLLTEEEYEGAHGKRGAPYRAKGSPTFRALELHFVESDMRVPYGEVTLSQASWQAAKDAVDLGKHRTDEELLTPVSALLRALGADGVVTDSLVETATKDGSPTFARLWRALRPMAERLYLAPSMSEVSQNTGMSERQIDRHVRSFVETFGLVGAGWRPATKHIRLRLAVLLLSAEDATIADVAKMVGYGSTDAMARAFRDASLPPPTTVREHVREPL